METDEKFAVGIAGVVVLVALLSGPVGFVELTEDRTDLMLDDGTATVSTVDVPSEEVRLERGRFGTGVYYLRLPTVSVHLDSVRGTPRLVYRVNVTGLDVDATATRIIDRKQSGERRLRLADRAFEPDGIEGGQYPVEISVRVQSFDVDETIYRDRTTISLQKDE